MSNIIKQNNKKSSLFLNHLSKVGGWTGVSRLFGLVRDIATSSLLGASVAHDIYVVIFKIPNVFRNTFGEGALNQAFIPIYSDFLKNGDELKTREFLDSVAGFLITSLFFFTIFVLIFAPIFVFTTEEIFGLINKKDNSSIHELTFVKIPGTWKNNQLEEKWKALYKIKQEVNLAIEEKRSNKEIGSSLEAELKITADKQTFDLLDGLDLSEYFITSKAQKVMGKDKEFKIDVIKTSGTKCPRCWKILDNKCERCETLIKSNI